MCKIGAQKYVEKLLTCVKSRKAYIGPKKFRHFARDEVVLNGNVVESSVDFDMYCKNNKISNFGRRK